MAAVIRLDTRQPVDPALLPAFGSFQAQLRAAAVAEHSAALLLVAQDIAHLEQLLPYAEPALAGRMRQVLAHAASIIVPELDAVGGYIEGRRA
ncbi:hypothetical protein [Methylobacterium isbiliense]|uniref:Uncharacterized protein n=1 Tax=Methylobacterium isbiliense TaxID=315478 RepID=A0ABQ4SG34_9HYPH|nr:hypothetical protein [Methylobacterium isbiliense]MDN3622566.1 hypothetical protein [Methylobacterium isbiliense]GJE01450.1 hypothetical protein GMJLKIPL_3381 [Methylobacterium isbiliense]